VSGSSGWTEEKRFTYRGSEGKGILEKGSKSPEKEHWTRRLVIRKLLSSEGPKEKKAVLPPANAGRLHHS